MRNLKTRLFFFSLYLLVGYQEQLVVKMASKEVTTIWGGGGGGGGGGEVNRGFLAFWLRLLILL